MMKIKIYLLMTFILVIVFSQVITERVEARSYVITIGQNEYKILKDATKNKQGTVTLNKFSNKGINATIPKTIKYKGLKYKITGIEGNAFADSVNMKSINIQSKIKEIQSGIFSRNSKLESVTIGEGVERLGNYLFTDKKNLTTVKLPDSVKHIGKYAFSGCPLSSDFVLPNNLETMDESAFSNCKNITILVIPPKLKEIPSKAFLRCEKLESIIFSSNLKKIGEASFYWCYGLKEINIPDGVEEIGQGAFYECFNITSIKIPSTIKLIGLGAFSKVNYNCKFIYESGTYVERHLQNKGYISKPEGTDYTDYDNSEEVQKRYLAEYGDLSQMKVGGVSFILVDTDRDNDYTDPGILYVSGNYTYSVELIVNVYFARLGELDPDNMTDEEYRQAALNILKDIREGR